jgi:hypothetical protein
MRRLNLWALALLGCMALYTIGLSAGRPRPEFSPSTVQHAWLNPSVIFHPDEFAYVGIPYRMLVERQWNPHYYHNPTLNLYTNMVAFWLSGAESLPHNRDYGDREIAPFQLYVMARALSALWTLLAVALTYAAGRLAFGRGAGPLAAGLVALSPLTVEHAHFATPNAQTTMLGTAALLLAVILFTGRQPLRLPLWAVYGLAGLLVGLTAAGRYNAGAVGLVTGLALLVAWRRDRRWSLVLFCLVAMPLGFVAGMPPVVLVPGEVIAQVRDILNWYRVRGGGAGFTADRGLLALAYHWRYAALIVTGPLAVALALLGLGAAVRGERPQHRQIALALLAYLLIYSALALLGRRLQANLLIPLLGPLALLAGYATATIRRRWGRRAGAVLAVALLVWPAVLTALLIYRIATPDTRLRAQEWVYAHVPRGTPIYLLGPYNVPLDPLDYPITQTYATEAGVDDVRATTAPLIVYSDAHPFVALRDRRASSPRAIARETAIRDLLMTEWHPLRHFARMPWPGERLPPDDVSYWSQIGITIYCRPADCPVGEFAAAP